MSKNIERCISINLVKTKDDLERESPRLKKEWIQKIDSIDNANRKYVLVFEDLIFEADNEQDILSRLIKDYIEKICNFYLELTLQEL